MRRANTTERTTKKATKEKIAYPSQDIHLNFWHNQQQKNHRHRQRYSVTESGSFLSYCINMYQRTVEKRVSQHRKFGPGRNGERLALTSHFVGYTRETESNRSMVEKWR